MLNHSVPTFLDRVLADFDRPLGTHRTVAPTGFRTAFDLVEHPDRFEIIADLPGTPRENVEVEFKDHVLEIRGERAAEAASEDARVIRSERGAGAFRRSIAFRDEVDVDAIAAVYKDGVLRVTVPKTQKAQPRAIEVSVN